MIKTRVTATQLGAAQRIRGHEIRSYARDLALLLAERIAITRFSHAGRSTWVGGVPQKQTHSLRFETLGPTLYSGTAGVALFLAAAARAGADTASAAREALAYAVDRTRADSKPGLFTGAAGVCVAETIVARLLDEPADARLDLLAVAANATTGFDLLSGRAGQVLALLGPGATSQTMRAASELGDELIASAVTRRHGLAWPTERALATRPLTGMSHGVAGVVVALAALAVATGDRRYVSVAKRALDYEDSTFDVESANWPDYRISSAHHRRGGRPTCMTYWCHGAPGIAMGRMLAHHLAPTIDLGHLGAALATTRWALRTEIDSGDPDTSLCHGVFGHVDVLLHARALRRYGKPAEDDVLIADAVRHLGDRLETGTPVHCGTHAAETPSGLLGWAGIGLTLLRIGEPSLPSLLDPTGLGSHTNTI